MGLIPGFTIGNTYSGISPTEDILVYENTSLYDPNWPTDLVLDWLKSNWQEWNRRPNIIVDQRYYGNYLDGTLRRPDSTTHPRSVINWDLKNRALRAFILEHISDYDYTIASAHSNAHDVYEALRKDHHSRLAQIKVFREALATRCVPTVPLSRTFDQITKLHAKFTKMGEMGEDLLLIILILNALGDDYIRLQTSVYDMLQNPSTTSADIRARLLREEKTIVLASVTGNPMAGRTIDDSETRAARIARRGASNKPRSNRTGTAIQSQASTGDNPKTLILNGKCYNAGLSLKGARRRVGVGARVVCMTNRILPQSSHALIDYAQLNLLA